MTQYTFTTTATVEALKITAVSMPLSLDTFDITLEDGSILTHEVAWAGLSGVRIGDMYVTYREGGKKIFSKEDFDKAFTTAA